MLRPLRLWTTHKELEMTLGTRNPRVNIKGGLLLTPTKVAGSEAEVVYTQGKECAVTKPPGPDPFLRGGIPDLKDAGAGQRTEVHLRIRCLGHRLKRALVT